MRQEQQGRQKAEAERDLLQEELNRAVQRHRLFESNVPLMAAPCAHHLQQERKYPPTRSDRTTPARVVSVFGASGGRAKNAALWAEAMDIDWMTKHGLAQAIPPAYTQFIGEQLLEQMTRKEVAA